MLFKEERERERKGEKEGRNAGRYGLMLRRVREMSLRRKREERSNFKGGE